MSEELVISDINGICRLCLKSDGTIIPIFGRENTSRDCIPLSKKILDCVSIKVFEGDGLPHMICVGCVHQVDSWHGFKNTCDISQKKLSSWLQKTSPDIFERNNAENKRKTTLLDPNLESSSIIDLSSDDEDDDVIITHQPLLRLPHSICGRRVRNRSHGHSQNIEVISIGTNEIEILPVDDKENSQLENESISSPSVAIDVIPNTILADSNPSDDHILPDTDVPENLENTLPCTDEHSPKESATKDSTPKKIITNGPLNSSTIECENVTEDASIEQIQIINSELASENQSSLRENGISDNTIDPLPVNQDSLMDQDNSNLSTSDGHETVAVDGVELSNKNSLETEKTLQRKNSYSGDDCSMSAADDCNTSIRDEGEKSTAGKPIEEAADHSLEDSSSLVIEKVTSLTNHDCERMDEDSNIREVTDREATGNWNRLSLQSEGAEVRPDIIMCDSSMVVNIKEEPLSAEEVTDCEGEEDPLNFQTVLVKREPEEWTNSDTEDVKPNIRLLNEAMENQYTPKRLKSGKLHCEPCRVSFINDVYYDRHTTSLRHKMNFKLFRSGKGPTRKRGKTLVQAILGSNYDYYPKGKGPFCCDECPSRFKHLRNLKTHQKKHLAETLEQEDTFEEFVSERISDAETSSQEEVRSSKPPMRQSAQNVKFITPEETKCDLCNQSFTTFPALVSHKRYCGFSGNRMCQWCHQNFTTTSLYFRHRKECLKLYRRQALNMSWPTSEKNIPSPAPSPVPMDGTVLACTLCNLTFHSSPDLITHMQQNHMDYGRPQSPIELPNFTKPNNFFRSRDSKYHYCKYCLRSFPSHGALSSHTGYHARKSIYCCKFCKQSYRDKLSFRQHMKVHIGDPNLNKNVCWICYTPFGSQKDLLDHKTVHVNIKMKIFSCNLCGNSYNTRELLSRHRKTAHSTGSYDQDVLEPVSEDVTNNTSKVQIIDEDNKLFKCKMCKKRFTTLGNLKRHSLKHKLGNVGAVSVEQSYQHRCGGCFRYFKTQSGLLNHRPVCTRVKTVAITNLSGVLSGNPINKALRCKGCKKWFASQSSLYKHKLLKRCRPQPENVVPENPLRPQNCPNCDQQFLSEESLARHKQHCKPSIERLTCDCGEVFPTVELKLAHADSCLANCTCKTCNIKFNSPEELESHQLVCQVQPPPLPSPQPTFAHENRLPPAVCTKCNKKFVYTKCLKIHQDKCLYDRWPCTNCLEIFPTETALATHKSHKTCHSARLNRSPSITPSKESPTFKCEHCPIRFVSANELKQHSLSCDGRPSPRRRDASSAFRPFNCDLCEKTFLWKANLYRHKKIIHKVLSSNQPINQSEVSGPKAVSTRSDSPASTHSDTGYYKCQQCPSLIFHKKQGYLDHKTAHERREGRCLEEETDEAGNSVLLTCELCDKKLPEALYPVHMDEHMNDDFEEMQQSSPKEEPTKFPCDICGKEFYSHVSRKSHRATHYRAGNLLAHLSPKKSHKKKKMKVKHIRCTTCNKLLSVNSMPKHKMMHVREAAEFYGENQHSTPSKSAPAVSTPRCSSPNTNSEMSGIQELTEEDGSSTFPCPKCDKSFKLRKPLLEHLKVHQDDSFETESTSSTTGTVDQFPYKCVYCDLSWKNINTYERHLGSKKHLEIQKQLSGII